MAGTSHHERPVRVRMAPSPTGLLHVGTARTALFNWLFARKHGGTFVLRIEDTDKERSKKEYEDNILEGLRWLGIDWDEGPLRQSERTEIYRKYLEQLLEKGEAYYCYCTREDLEAQRQSMLDQGLPPKYSGRCRNLSSPPEGKSPEAIRFKVPETKVTFKDLVRGKVTFDAALFGDQIIAKDLDRPLYNFAVVVDDELMGITHVIRGEDHISNTPKQILMQQALGFKEPVYAHIPLLLNADRSKMSKRFLDVALLEYRSKGYLPEAMLNFLALLGWHPKDDREILSREDLVKEFEIERVQQAGAIFNEEKLAWINKEYIKNTDDTKLAELLAPMIAEAGIKANENFLKRVIAAEKQRMSTLHDFIENDKFFFELPEYDAKLLAWKDVSLNEVPAVLQEILKAFENIPEAQFTTEIIMKTLTQIVGSRSRGVVFWPLRVALSGRSVSPDPVLIAHVLSKEETLRRIGVALKKIG